LAIFAFVFDDFWDVARSPSVSSFLEVVLGKGFLQNSTIWAHWVGGSKRVGGWYPHVDSAWRKEEFLSVWISLSDATVENGCMFLVRHSGIAREITQAIAAKETLPYRSYVSLLHSVVALPVPAGSMIGWRGDVLHWGGVNSDGVAPRVSLALEFQSRDAETHPFELPMIDQRNSLPPFGTRMFAIAKALREFRKFEPAMSRYLPLAERIWSEIAPSKRD
jgi:hypothetical protein